MPAQDLPQTHAQSRPHPALAPSPVPILAFEHVGIRVSQRDEAIAFYRALGFDEVLDLQDGYAAELCGAHGVRINLIFNGTRQAGRHNVLLDAPVRLPGITHPAFVVDDLDALVRWLDAQGIAITEGPHPIGPRRVALFIRDPDGNVLEFNQLLERPTTAAPSSSAPPPTQPAT